MKVLTVTVILFLSSCLPASGQGNEQRVLFQTRGKSQLYYVDVSHTGAVVYKMGGHLDKAGVGFSILYTDTLVWHGEGIYAGRITAVVLQNGILYLVPELKSAKKWPIDTVINLRAAHENLNNGYYLDHYFRMSNELNKVYPLGRHSFRKGFYTWRELQNKEMDHLLFRVFAQKRLKDIKDSISNEQERYLSRAKFITENIGVVDYHLLKDSLAALPADYPHAIGYYQAAVREVARQKPEYFFRLGEDIPGHRSRLFQAAGDSKETIRGLQAVEGYAEIKKEFFKERRFERTISYKVLGAYTFIGGLIAFLILSQ